MNDPPTSWLVLANGTPVLANDGTEVGKVSAVVGDRQKDIFSGVAYKPGRLNSEVFAPADAIAKLDPDAVRLSLSAHEAERLDHYGG